MKPLKIPNECRSGGYLRPCFPGLSLPRWFLDNLQSIDKDLYPIFHPVKVLYDDFLNNYTGALEDPRFVIGTPNGYGEEIWGFPLKQAKNDEPILDGTFHVWRLARSAGAWCHVVQIESKMEEYLQFVLDRLHFQAVFTAKYGHIAYNRKMRELQEENQQKDVNKNNQLLSDVNTANKLLIKSAMENFSSGNVAPTNPTKEIISSFSGQTNKTKIVRPITDAEGGLVLPDKWSNN